MTARTALLAFALALASASVSAQESTKSARADLAAPGLLFWFQGDVTGNNVSNVLTKLYGKPSPQATLATESYVVSEKDNLCSIMTAQGYPPPCEGYLPLLDLLNADSGSLPLSKRPLQTGMKINLPAIKLMPQPSLRVFSKDQVQSQAASNLVKNLRDVNAHVVEPKRPTDSIGVQFTSYKMLVPTTSDESAESLYRDFLPLGSKNILITPLTNSTTSGAKFNAYHQFRASSQIQNDCVTGKLNDKVENYAGLLDGDGNAYAAAIEPLKEKRPAVVPVIIVDTILQQAPNIVARFAIPPDTLPPPTWTCKWGTFVDIQNHATHMAGIIAGSGSPFAFQGVAENVRLIPYEWWKPESSTVNNAIKGRVDRDTDLAAEIIDNYRYANVLPVYLAALQFDDYPVAALATSDRRFENRPLESTIKDSRPLLIAAAGQRNKPTEPIVAISNVVASSPQNLGDLENVVIVTACTVCGNGPAVEPKLMADAYYSAPGYRMVHVAAPGAEPIAGWIDKDTIGESMGTSHAAAYVAGLAASMIGHFPGVYTEAKVIKTRLQVTSRPIPPNSDNSANPDAKKITAGIVDPILARLDPSKHWLKDSSGWKSVKIAKLPTADVGLKNVNGQITYMRPKALLRITKTKPASAGSPNLWSYYVDAYKATTGRPGDVDRHDFLKSFSGAAITLCDTSIAFDRVEDLIISTLGVAANECSS